METNKNIIKLNVGGRIFQTTKQTLISGSEYFRDIFENSQDADSKDSNEPLFIDRSYEAFEHVLSLLRNSKYKFPDLYNDELDYFGIKYKKINSIVDDNIEIYFINDECSFIASKKVLSQYPYFNYTISQGDNIISIDETQEIFSIIYDVMKGKIRKFEGVSIRDQILEALCIYEIKDKFEISDIDSINIFTSRYRMNKRGDRCADPHNPSTLQN